MAEEFKMKPLYQALRQTSALVGLELLLAIGGNQCRPGGIKLLGDWSDNARFADASGQSLVIPLEEARDLFEEDEVLFVDARPESQYQEGHLPGALLIPWQEVDRYFMEAAEQLEEGKAIVAYCDGESCELSHELALFLKDMGFPNARVLVNGWSVWRNADLPVEEGN